MDEEMGREMEEEQDLAWEVEQQEELKAAREDCVKRDRQRKDEQNSWRSKEKKLNGTIDKMKKKSKDHHRIQ